MIFDPRRLVLIALVLLIVLSPMTVVTVRADYSVSISGDSVSVKITSVYVENITTTPQIGYSIVLSGSNASSAAALFTSALNSSVPGARVGALTIRSSSSGNTSQTTFSFDVLGAATTTRDGVRFNMAWKSFRITEDIVAMGISINKVGSYLAESSVMNQVTSRVVQWSYFEDGQSIISAQSSKTASSFVILDFSQLSSPVSSWPQTFKVGGGLTTTFTSGEKHNITAEQVLSEGGTGGVIRTRFFAGYSHNVQIDVLGSAHAIGDSILTDENGTTTSTMVALAVIFPIAGVAAFVVERRVSRGQSVYGKKTPRRPRR